MKASMFNILTERKDGSVLCFNSLWGTLAAMDKKNWDTCKAILRTGYDAAKAAPEMHDLAVQLKKGGFMVDDSIDELEYLKQRYVDAKSELPIFRLYVVPTSACNFACKYCYYAGSGKTGMTEEVQDALLEFTKKRIGSRKVLNVVWTGGEPTLAPDAVIRLSRGFGKIARDLDIAYSAAVFTNGYLFDRDMAEEFHEHGIQVAQIVVDGPQRIHDDRRPLINGSGTFERIMANLKAISGVIDIAVRINLDSTNADSRNVRSLLDSLKNCGLPSSTIVELARIMSYTSHCCGFVKKYGLSSKEFGDRLSELYPLVFKSGFTPKFDLSPELNISPCTAGSCFGVSEEGDLYRCFLLMGEKHECAGNLLKDQGPPDRSNNDTKWDKWNPFLQEKCIHCSILPLCLGGGCPLYDVVQNESLREDVRCLPLKFYLDGAMELNCRMQQSRRGDGNAV